MLSQRTRTRLKDLLASLVLLFPTLPENWPHEKIFLAAQQLRGLESALRRGVTFLTPPAEQLGLKDPTQQHDIL
ncbi:hypothetical protein EBR21_09630 [bacterium]|nr:hypothetical protein [bacterium]